MLWYSYKWKAIIKKLPEDQRPKFKAIMVLEENIGISLCDLGLGDDFLDVISNTQATKGIKIHLTSSESKLVVLQRIPSRK